MTKILKYPEVDFLYTDWIFDLSHFPRNWFPEIGETFRAKTSVLDLTTGKFYDQGDFATIKVKSLARPKNLVGEGFARICEYINPISGNKKDIGVIFCGSIRMWELRKERHKLAAKPIKES